MRNLLASASRPLPQVPCMLCCNLACIIPTSGLEDLHFLTPRPWARHYALNVCLTKHCLACPHDPPARPAWRKSWNGRPGCLVAWRSCGLPCPALLPVQRQS